MTKVVKEAQKCLVTTENVEKYKKRKYENDKSAGTQGVESGLKSHIRQNQRIFQGKGGMSSSNL